MEKYITDFLKSAKNADKELKPLKNMVLKVGSSLAQNEKELDSKKKRFEEGKTNGARLTKHRFTL